jgi:hypothetical protein
MNAAFFVTAILAKLNMEISDEKLRQIVRETLRELGADADPALVCKVVRDVVRQLEKKDAQSRRASIHQLAVAESKALAAPVADEKSNRSSESGY